MFIVESFKRNYLFIFFSLIVGFLTIFFLDAYEKKISPKNVHECVLKNVLGVKDDAAAQFIVKACEKKFMSKDDCEKNIANSLCKKKIEEARFHGECAIHNIKRAQSPAGAKLAFIFCETKAAYEVWELKKEVKNDQN